MKKAGVKVGTRMTSEELGRFCLGGGERVIYATDAGALFVVWKGGFVYVLCEVGDGDEYEVRGRHSGGRDVFMGLIDGLFDWN